MRGCPGRLSIPPHNDPIPSGDLPPSPRVARERSGPELQYEVLVPSGPSNLDEVEQVLQVIEGRSEITRLVVGVRKRSAIGKAVLGSIPQRLILEATVPVLSVKSVDA